MSRPGESRVQSPQRPSFQAANLPMLRSLMTAIKAILARVRGPGPSIGVRKLADERRGHFFIGFHFDPLGEPAPAGPGRAWHCFRPNGEAFRTLVELDILVDRAGRIWESRLGLDRAFVDHPRNGAFARDLVKSYLQWGLTDPARSPARALIENIASNVASQTAGGAPTLPHARGLPPMPGDTTGCYLVYLGKRTTAEAIVGNSKLAITNLLESFPDQRIFDAMLGSQDLRGKDLRGKDRPNAPWTSAHPGTLRSAHRPSWLRLDISPAITLH